jgi:DNA-binding response OmpR family regulator
MAEKKQLGRILLKQKAITADQLEQALSEPGGRLASRLTEQGTISGLAALKALSEQHGIPGIDLEQVCVSLADLELLPREIAEKHLILPVLSRGERLFVAMANPRERKVIDELEFVTGKKVYPYVALESPLAKVIEDAYGRRARGERFYVGPRCPAETLQKLGIDAQGQPVGQASEWGPISEVEEEPAPASSIPPSNSMTPSVNAETPDAQASLAELGEDGFGDVSQELSVITDLPERDSQPLPDGARTVLIVDDEAEIRRMLERLLTSRGYRVLQADAGLMALKMVKEHSPDLIVLDAMLPEVHGFDIARRIKGSKRYGGIPIVMVSAVYRGWHYAEDLKESCGVEAFVEKPFKIQQVVDAVEVALAGSARQPRLDPEQMHQEAEEALTAGVAAYKAGNLDTAVHYLKRGVDIDPLAYRLHFHLGLLYGRKGQVFDAITALEQAVEINSRHFPAMKNLAILYQKAGFRNKAAEMWQRALVVAPDDLTRQTIKKQLLALL